MMPSEDDVNEEMLSGQEDDGEDVTHDSDNNKDYYHKAKLLDITLYMKMRAKNAFEKL